MVPNIVSAILIPGDCSSHASAIAACEQNRPKHGEGKDQANDTYN